jgi:hypothetical protein
MREVAEFVGNEERDEQENADDDRSSQTRSDLFHWFHEA